MTRIPTPVPELPVADIPRAARFYVEKMGFALDWTYEDYLAGISKDDARIFLRHRTAEEAAAGYCVLVWLNMDSAADVDALNAQWITQGVAIREPLRTAPYNLREFIAEDPDGNRFRVFHDLGDGKSL
jgi:predicted enzyme related to lactoylglutathione lyase